MSTRPDKVDNQNDPADGDKSSSPQWAWAGLIGLAASTTVLALIYAGFTILFATIPEDPPSGAFVVVAILITVGLLALIFYLLPWATAKFFDWRDFGYRSRWNFLPAYFMSALGSGAFLVFVSNLYSATHNSSVSLLPFLLIIGVYLLLTFLISGFSLVWTSQWSEVVGKVVSIVAMLAFSLFLLGAVTIFLIVSSWEF